MVNILVGTGQIIKIAKKEYSQVYIIIMTMSSWYLTLNFMVKLSILGLK